MINKNTKKDLIWIIPEFIGVMSILYSAVHHLSNTPSSTIVGLWEWIFQVSLVLCVMGLGIKGLIHVLNEIKKLL